MGGTSRTCLASVEDSYPDEFRRLQRVFASRGVGAEESADLTQETVARAILHLQRHGQQADDIRPLLNHIARNLLIERVRTRSAQVVEIVAADDLPDPAPEPAERAEAAERAERVRAGLAQIPARHRQVVRLWMEGYDPEAIGRELGIKRNAAYALLHRARRKLVAALGEQGPFGLVVVAWAGLRLRARRLANTVASLDPTGGLAPSGASLAAVGAAAVIVIGSGGISSAGPVGMPEPSAAGAEVLQVDDAPTSPDAAALASDGADRSSDGGVAEERAVEVEVAERRVVARANAQNPTDPEDDELSLEIWHKPGETSRGITGPLVERASEQVCDNSDLCRRDG